MSREPEHICLRHIELEQHSGRVPRGVENAGAGWSERRGVVLRLVDDVGCRGLGEASPLPGYSPDSLIDSHRVLTQWRDWWRAGDGGFGAASFRAASSRAGSFEASVAGIKRQVDSLPITQPAARFGLETALLDVLGQRVQRSVPQLLAEAAGREPMQSVPVAAVASCRALGPFLDEIDSLWARGVRTLKVKIGYAGEFEAEMEKLQRLRQTYAGELHLRLDANGGMPRRGIQEKLAALSEVSPEFLEEPMPWPELADLDASPVPLALDESLLCPGVWSGLPSWLASGVCTVVVLKPLLHGGVLACLDLARRLENLVPIASHGFDGPIALDATRALALVLGDQLAHGVASHAGLEAWKTSALAAANNPSQVVNGRLETWSEPGFVGRR